MGRLKLRFIIDKEYDRATAKNLLFLKRHSKADLSSLDKTYRDSENVLNISKRLYQTSWNEINDPFFGLIKKITGHDWMYSDYECVVSVINPGATNYGVSNRIMLWWKLNPYFMRRIAAHELIIHHYFAIYNKRYKEEGLSEHQVWALAEVAAYTLTSLPEEVKKFWPWSMNYMGSYLPGTAYPELDDLRIKLKQPFLKRKSFDEYMRKGFELVRKYPNLK